jgi:hypothetical protein
MTTNEQLIQLMQEHELDTRPDPKLNRDVDKIAEILEVSRYTVINWLKPPTWNGYRVMRKIFLEKLEREL